MIKKPNRSKTWRCHIAKSTTVSCLQYTVY